MVNFTLGLRLCPPSGFPNRVMSKAVFLGKFVYHYQAASGKLDNGPALRLSRLIIQRNSENIIQNLLHSDATE